MIKITRYEWNKIPNDYKGIFEDYQGNAPELEGKQTWLTWLEGEGTSLIFEGIHFEIIDNE